MTFVQSTLSVTYNGNGIAQKMTKFIISLSVHCDEVKCVDTVTKNEVKRFI